MATTQFGISAYTRQDLPIKVPEMSELAISPA